jgi:FAD synthase
MISFNQFITEHNTVISHSKTWTIGDYIQYGFDPVVFAIGKFNPPHVGHHQVIQQLISLSSRLNAKAIVFVIDTEKRSPNSPLDGNRRIHYLRQLFPNVSYEIASNAYDAIMSLIDHKLLPVGEVTGDDRSYRKDIARIFGNPVAEEEQYITNPILRDEDMKGVMGASSSKMRTAITNNDMRSFMELTGLPYATAEQLMKEVTIGMGLQ